MYDSRLNLWEDFNHCWLALLQRQLYDTEKIQGSEGGSSATQNTLPRDSLENLSNQITSLCDEMEKMGLVDYQMGVWEEEIVRSKQAAITSPYQNAPFTDYSQCLLDALMP